MLMYVDINSCFASIEQQANPLLRGKPVVVAAYETDGGCILASSIEAKKMGIKTGMKVKESRRICSRLIVLVPDPQKYRFVNKKLLTILQEYSSKIDVCSIDEMVIDFKEKPRKENLREVALEIKQRIKKEIGEYLTVSIGIAQNRFWAKLGSTLQKPDGLVEINNDNMEKILLNLKLSDIPGIKEKIILRLKREKIDTPLQFYQADVQTLKRAFGGICGYYWYLRLHSFEIDNNQPVRKSYSHSYALYKTTAEPAKLLSILCRLIEKMGKRLRQSGYTTSEIHVGCFFTDNTYWHGRRKNSVPLYGNSDLLKHAYKILLEKPPAKSVKILSVSCHSLKRNLFRQIPLIDDEIRKFNLIQAIDKLNSRYGDFVVTSPHTIGMKNKILDRIAFGGETREFNSDLTL